MPNAPVPGTSAWPSPSPTERYTRTLVNLTREVWDPDCTFETAIGAICEGAAWALDVERVSVWNYSRDDAALNCLESWDAIKRTHTGGEDQETLAIDAEDYMSMLQEVRFLSSVRPDGNAPREVHRGVFPDFIQRFRMHAVLDAPACLGGELFGAICHESRHAERIWTNEETTFAASMGDFVAMAYEISRRRDAEKEVAHLLLHDVKTGLANRDYLVELTRQRLLLSGNEEQPVAIVVVLIDSSSVSSCAHAPSAEDVMVRIAEELRQLCDNEVVLARVHSNKFAFLLTRDAVHGTAIDLAERCLDCMFALDWEDAETAPGMAVGIAFAGEQTNDEPATLLRQAEEAAQRAQAANNLGYEVFEPAHHNKLVERLRLERVLRRALAYDEFEVYYQPEYDTVRQQWVAAEALLRWNNEGIVLDACQFMEVAESSGLMVPLGKFVLRQACRDAADWSPTCDGNLLALRVNVSARQFASDSLVDDIASALEDSGLSPDRLCLEITETTLMESIDAALITLNALRATGIHLAIDDFGTGFASLVYLKRLPVDILKIDRTFVCGLPKSRVDTAIVSAIVGLAGALNIDVIAEGVESVDQQEALTAIGVRRMQGWLYARAMKPDALLELIGMPMPRPLLTP
jgi:EAL domain-containing protein (putative c-di-GMP-specific phosphodiesterase class I)/GGDEF domain-containing protein